MEKEEKRVSEYDKIIEELPAVVCAVCGDAIYSRARHDMRYCSCGHLAVDGGFDYIKMSGNQNDGRAIVPVNATRRQLYYDWNSNEDKFGLVKLEEPGRTRKLEDSLRAAIETIRKYETERSQLIDIATSELNKNKELTKTLQDLLELATKREAEHNETFNNILGDTAKLMEKTV